MSCVSPGCSGDGLSVWFPSIRAHSGADIFVERLANALQRAGVNVVVTWFSHAYELAPFALALTRPPDGVNVIHSNAACAFAFVHWGLPVVATEHHYVLDVAFRPYKSLFQHIYHQLWIGPWTHLSYRSCSALTAISHFTADVIERHCPGVQARVIPHWLDYYQFSPCASGSDGGDEGYALSSVPVRLLFIGNLSRRKGGDVVAELARRLGSDFEISCTGGLRNRAAEGGRVHNLGRLPQWELIEALRACDGVLVPSRYEGFGYAALEAMACEKPVIGFRCGGVQEVVGKEVDNFLVDIDDIDALEACCRQLKTERVAAARRLGRRGRARALSVYSEDRAVRSYIEIYRSLLAPVRKA